MTSPTPPKTTRHCLVNDNRPALCQGTTLVVPKSRQNEPGFRRVASVTTPKNYIEGAPGPSLLGTGENPDGKGASSERRSRLKLDLFSRDGVRKFQKFGVQEISSIAGEAGEIFERQAG